jgi:hypothetical protein
MDRTVLNVKDAPTLFTADGKRGTNIGTVSRTVSEISAAMLKAKGARESFEHRDLRRTVETMLIGNLWPAGRLK